MRGFALASMLLEKYKRATASNQMRVNQKDFEKTYKLRKVIIASNRIVWNQKEQKTRKLVNIQYYWSIS